MELEELKVYEESMALAERVWSLVDKWSFFQKDTVGKQLIRSVDSVASNLSEGFGRYHFREKKNFAYYSRGSLFETRTWLRKAHSRKLISDAEYNALYSDFTRIGKMLNKFIRSIGETTITNPQ